MTFSQKEERRLIGNSRSLLHIVGHHNDSIVRFQLFRKIFDFGCGNRIQRAGRFVHQDDFRLHRQRSGDTQTLLLAPGQTQSALLETVLQFIPDRRISQETCSTISSKTDFL